jgi:predicted DNA-binding transcriptional regulator AlpA
MNDGECLLTVKAVAALVTFSVRKIWRDVAAKLFPKPIKLGPKTTRWKKSDIRRFLDGEWTSQPPE